MVGGKRVGATNPNGGFHSLRFLFADQRKGFVHFWEIYKLGIVKPHPQDTWPSFRVYVFSYS